MEPKEIKFTLEKETANTFCYKEVVADGEKPIVGLLYVRKDVAGDRKELTVTIK